MQWPTSSPDPRGERKSVEVSGGNLVPLRAWLEPLSSFNFHNIDTNIYHQFLMLKLNLVLACSSDSIVERQSTTLFSLFSFLIHDAKLVLLTSYGENALTYIRIFEINI